MHLKVFVKMKKTLKTLSSGQKNPKKPKKKPKNLKKTKKQKKNKKTHRAGFFLKNRVFFQPCLKWLSHEMDLAFENMHGQF